MILSDAQLEEIQKEIDKRWEWNILDDVSFRGMDVSNLLDTIRHLQQELRKAKKCE